MDPHTFTPDGPGSPSCAHCPLPSGNRVHRVDPPSPAARILASPHGTTALDAPRPSADAAERVLRVGAGTARSAVLTRIAACPPDLGLTDAELFAALADRYAPNTLRPRRNELAQASPPLVVEVTDAAGAPLVRGDHTAWTVTEAGRDALREVSAA